MSFNIVQINMNHCWSVHNLLQQFIKERNISIALVMEPIYIPGKNWIDSISKGSAIHWTSDVNFRVKVVFRKEEFVAIEVNNIVFISCYIPPSSDLRKFSEVLDELESSIKILDNRKQIVLGGDFNAHSKLWGSKYTSCKGDKLISYMEAINLTLVNEGNAPTCVRHQGDSVIDLTWATPQIARSIESWKVEISELSLSDHNYITFSINTNRRLNKASTILKNIYPRWKFESMDQELFKEIIEWNCSTFNIDESGIARDVDWIRETMTEAADASTTRVKKAKNKKQVHWWNEGIAELRRRCICDRRIWTKAKSAKKKGKLICNVKLLRIEEEYRDSKKKLVLAISKAKEDSWKSLIREIDNDPWGIPYKLVMNKLRINSHGLTETLEKDKLRMVIYGLFPRETKIESVRDTIIHEWNDDWDVGVNDINRVIKRKNVRSTAPGIDGITLKMWRKVPASMVNRLSEIYTKCLRSGEFPIQWKRAKLVLIPKGKVDEQEIPKARPICLIDDVGKGLERIIVERIENWMEEALRTGFRVSAVGNNQYGFRKNKSTIDALNKVKASIEAACKNGEVTIIISLDIENAFNSIPWNQIRNMMKRKRLPSYLVRILNSYFNNRSVEYLTAEKLIEKIDVQRGVPQGSVLGPLIWNLVYDRVLKVKKEKGCELIGYADDTLIMSVAKTYKEAKYNACMQAERTIRAIRAIGLKVAVEKTESMVFFGKKGKRPPNNDYIDLEGKEIKIGNKLKYLGMFLDSKLNFLEHFRYVQDKVEKVRRALCRLMPNLRGPHEHKRRLYSYVIQSVVMYGAPVWYDSFVKKMEIQRPLRKIQRQMAIRIISGYRTIAYEVAIILARTPPWDLVARKYKRTYDKLKRLKEENEWNRHAEKEVRREEEDYLMKSWKKRMKNKDLPGQKIRGAIHEIFTDWMNRRHGGMNYQLTQILTGHGCFNSYLERIKKVESALCTYCNGFIDDAEHTLCNCEEWNTERDELKYIIDNSVSIANIVKAICTSKKMWQGVNTFAQKVMSKKEDDERMEKQRKEGIG